MREIAILRGAVSGIFCGVLFWLGMLFTHGTSDLGWDALYLLPVAAVLLGPLALVVWSIVAGLRWRAQTLRWTRRLILCHGALGLVFMLAACSEQLERLGVPISVENYDIVGVLAALIDLVLLALMPRPSTPPEAMRLYRKVALGVAGGALVAVAIWPFVVLGLVATEAEIIAGSRPYCIQVPSEDYGYGYNGATSLSDLHGLKMYARGDSFHAVLVVQAHDAKLKWWNWSYWQERFVPIPDDTRKALYLSARSCAPEVHFVLQLPITRRSSMASPASSSTPGR